MCSFKLAVHSLRWARSSISILRFVSMTIQAAVIWLLRGREVLLVAIYRISSSRSWWYSTLHSPLPIPTQYWKEHQKTQKKRKIVLNFRQAERQMLQQPLLDSAPSTVNTWGCTMIISLHQFASDVQANERGGPLPHPCQAIQLLLLLLQPKTSQITETHHNYHVTGTIETWRRSTHSNKPQPRFLHFSLPVFCFIFTLKCLSIWSEGERKQTKNSQNKQTKNPTNKQTKKTPPTNNPNQKTPPQLHVKVSGHRDQWFL